MCPDHESELVKRSPGRAAQRGFSIVAAIFLIVVLAALGAFMVTFSSVQHITSAQDLQGARAYQAARAGIEWGSYKALRSASCVTSTPLTLGGTLAGFAVTVACSNAGPFTEGANTVNVYTVVSTASLGTPASSTYVERQLQATIGK
jgi:MSHA biogenesis protein MshP